MEGASGLISVEGEGVSMDTTSIADAHGEGSDMGLSGNFLFPLASKSVSSVFSDNSYFRFVRFYLYDFLHPTCFSIFLV